MNDQRRLLADEVSDREVIEAVRAVPAHYLFQPGYNKGVTFTPTGGTPQTLNITGWKWVDTGEILDVSHTGTAGLQALLAGLQRGDGNVKANFDASQIICNSPVSVKFGQGGVINYNLGTTNPYQIPVMVAKVNYQSEVAGKVEYDFDVRLNTLAGSLVLPN